MLKKFSVENFKGFKDKITFDIGRPGEYGFHPEIIEENCITRGIIYGINGCGKSNLGLAIFDMITHLTDKQKLYPSYDYYLNMDSQKTFAEFEYTFVFDGHELVYRYTKTKVDVLREESLSIDGKEVIHYDFLAGDGFTVLEGSETLNSSIKRESPISRVKYVSSNSILADNTQNQVFRRFIGFVGRMLLFYSLDSKGYEGFRNGSVEVADGIVNAGKVKDFQSFLKENGTDYDLYGCDVDGHKALYCRFDNKDADFFRIASSGTRSLALFYYWYILMEKASFVFMDEFDAFYHFGFSEAVQKKINEIQGVQVFATTHNNTDLMSNYLLRPDCFFLLKDNRIKPLSDLIEKEVSQEYSRNDIYSGKIKLEKCSAETVYKLAKALDMPMEILTEAGIRQTEREKAYEYGLPEYLQHDLDAYKEGLRNHSSLLDCLWGELYGSINLAAISDGVITPEHADYLRKKFLYGENV